MNSGGHIAFFYITGSYDDRLISHIYCNASSFRLNLTVAGEDHEISAVREATPGPVRLL